MKYREALIAWNSESDQIKVGELPSTSKGKPDWTKRPIKYRMSGGAANIAVRHIESDQEATAKLIAEFLEIILRDGVNARAAHEEFLKIDEYRNLVTPLGLGSPIMSIASTE